MRQDASKVLMSHRRSSGGGAAKYLGVRTFASARSCPGIITSYRVVRIRGSSLQSCGCEGHLTNNLLRPSVPAEDAGEKKTWDHERTLNKRTRAYNASRTRETHRRQLHPLFSSQALTQELLDATSEGHRNLRQRGHRCQ